MELAGQEGIESADLRHGVASEEVANAAASVGREGEDDNGDELKFCVSTEYLRERS